MRLGLVGTGAGKGKLGLTADVADAVSYTHLDVYKRQGEHQCLPQPLLGTELGQFVIFQGIKHHAALNLLDQQALLKTRRLATTRPQSSSTNEPPVYTDSS